MGGVSLRATATRGMIVCLDGLRIILPAEEFTALALKLIGLERDETQCSHNN
ncbi:hypothetical protein LEADMMO150B3_23090 [Leclercia adecarboxylata]|jgi:hypothetical protein